MPSATRFLQSSSQFPASDNPPINLTMNSDVVLVLASLLCALICVLGLALAARCAWLRRSSLSSSGPTASKGIGKKALSSLPKSTFGSAPAEEPKLTDCAICLAEFEDGEQIRVLPRCGHAFHVWCIDTWLGSHSSCPSCRQVLVVPVSSTCRKCGASSAAAAGGGGGDSRFLP